MSNTMPNNGKTYTEVVLEFTQMLTESERRQTEHNIEVLESLAGGTEKFKAIYDKMDGKGGMNERIKTNATTGKSNADKIKVVGGIEAALLMLCAWMGLSK